MKGKHEVIVRNRRIKYKFTVERNITILRGDSATGKTTLIEMIAEYRRRGEDSGISLSCDKECVVLNPYDWKLIIGQIRDSIVFIDEGEDFVKSNEFAEFIRKSDNYYVIATRTTLANLPYSIKEVYGIKNIAGNRYQGTKRLYSEFYPLYSIGEPDISTPDCVIVEDKKSGYQFFKGICDKHDVECISANGNANLERVVAACKRERILVIADGAAFGPYIERLLDLSRIKNIAIYLPESFEWLILKSGLIKDASVKEVLRDPSEYIESKKYFSWEQFFTALLKEKTKGTYLVYNKAKLNPVYLHKNTSAAIMKEVPVNMP